MSIDANYNSQFLQIDFRLLDDPKFIGFVNRPEFATYLILRRFIWRGGEHRLGLHDFYHNQRKLVSSISGKRIASMLGLRDVTWVSKHLSYLVDLKVVERIRTGRESIFVLGEWIRPPSFDVAKEYYYVENVFGAALDDLGKNQNQTWGRSPNQILGSKPSLTWGARPSSNIKRNKEKTVNGGRSVLALLPDIDQPKEKAQVLTNDILAAMGDRHSERFYALVAAKVPEHVIRKALAEVRQDGSRQPPKVFTSRMMAYALRQAARRIGTLGRKSQRPQRAA